MDEDNRTAESIGNRINPIVHLRNSSIIVLLNILWQSPIEGVDDDKRRPERKVGLAQFHYPVHIPELPALALYDKVVLELLR